MSTVGFARFFLADLLRQRAARAQVRAAANVAGTLGWAEETWLADAYTMFAELLDQREERRRVMTLACSYPITLTTAKRYHRKYGDSAGAAIELELRSGRTP